MVHRLRNALGHALPPVAALLGLGLVWQAAVVGLKLPAYLLPPPTAIIEAGAENFGFILTHLGKTLRTIAIGFTVGALFGVFTASAIVYSPLAGRVIYPLVILT